MARAVSRRRGFTLTELLIVIAIIAVLAGLITAAAVQALKASNRSRISLEIRNIATAMENLKNEYGVYPPNAMNPSPASNPAPNSSAALVQSDFVRMFKKAFPRSQEPPGLILALCGQNLSGTNLENGMNAAEALYFWLGGFSDDPQYPISGQGGPSFRIDTSLPNGGEILEDRQGGYDFDLGRLGPRNDDELAYDEVRYLEYEVMINGTLQQRGIRFWSYRPSGSERPLVYFDTSRYKPAQYDVWAVNPNLGSDTPWIYAFKRLREGVTEPTGQPRELVFVNQDSFQIIHPGLDDAWGQTYVGGANQPPIQVTNSEDWLLFPEGPFIGEIADTLTNFTDGDLEDAQEE
jgi:prepilin-type N-terminal cleavage/methylation domain-containing protein